MGLPRKNEACWSALLLAVLLVAAAEVGAAQEGKTCEAEHPRSVLTLCGSSVVAICKTLCHDQHGADGYCKGSGPDARCYCTFPCI